MAVRKTLARVQSEGYDALGPEDAVRFIRDFDPGSSDYTKERKKTFGKKTAKQISKEISGLEKSL